MNKYKGFDINFFYSFLVKLSPTKKIILLVFLDILSILLITLFSIFLEWENDNLFYTYSNILRFLILFIFTTISLYVISGQYRGLSLYISSTNLYQSFLRNSLSIFLAIPLLYILRINLPTSKLFFLILIFTTFVGSFIKVFLRDIFLFFKLSSNSMNKKLNVAIYGAGEAGAQLSASLKFASEYSLICFFDDDKKLWGRNIRGVPIFSPDLLSKKSNKINYVLLSIPSLSPGLRLEIINSIQKYNLPVLEVPSLEDIASGKSRIDSLRPISIEDILGRDSVLPHKKLLGPGIKSSVVLVTGAGGSIGSELCRQIIKLKPKVLLLLDMNEHGLYLIKKELGKHISSSLKLVPILGNFTEDDVIKELFYKYMIDTIFHAAAYKHVPLVEENPLQGLKNNSIGTYKFCKLIIKYGFSGTFVLISSDKAVRPTNIMGASKRLSELVVQSFAHNIPDKVEFSKDSKPRFSMVRFGNVLNSSGSVVPLFKEQIKNGGPITLTHEDVTRYFMTIPEAAQLVIQASVLTECGDVFLLDMGKPIKIKELAIKMINLAGLKVKDKDNPEGDIEIRNVGLRKGEKLYEELLIDAESQKTSHPLIYRAEEKSIPPQKLWPNLDLLEKAINNSNFEESIRILRKLLPEYNFRKK